MDGGQNGNLLAGPHYFDMALRHLSGGIYPAYTEKEQLINSPHQKLVLKSLDSSKEESEDI